MKKGQKILVFVLSAVTVLTLTACNNDSGSPSASTVLSSSQQSNSISSQEGSNPSQEETGSTQDVEEIPESSVGDFEYEYDEELDGMVITKYIGSDSSVKIPSAIEGKRVVRLGRDSFKYCDKVTVVVIPDGVTSIGESACWACSSLISVIIPDSIKSIGENAFWECRGLTDITIPSGVTTIENRVFGNCESLSKIAIPEGVTSIGDSAFTSCTALESITIPESTANIGERSFYNCTSLKEINVDESNESFISKDGVLFNKDMTLLISFPGAQSGEYTVPDSVTSIGNSAFYGCENLTSATYKGKTYSYSDIKELYADING